MILCTRTGRDDRQVSALRPMIRPNLLFYPNARGPGFQTSFNLSAYFHFIAVGRLPTAFLKSGYRL